MLTLLICGGAGFIGSNFTHYWLKTRTNWNVIVFDKLTYAGNLNNLIDLAENPRFKFVEGDICDEKATEAVVSESDVIVNFAAETHVDRSLLDPGAFILTDVYGTHILLESVVRNRERVQTFLQISSDEVYGTVIGKGAIEESLLAPSSPYSASKAGGDMMTLAYQTTYRFPVLITRSTNNFGPFQHPEKFMPLFITNAINDLPLPVYGDGLQIRDWLYVLDHSTGIADVLEKGKSGEIYNIGANNEKSNIEVAKLILDFLDKPHTLIRHVDDRPGHDRRYAVDCSKIGTLGWKTRFSFENALEKTVRWYLDQKDWWQPIRNSKAFTTYYDQVYGTRLN